MSKYDKSFNIFLTNKTQNGLDTAKTLYTFNFSKPIIIPPYSSYTVTNLAANRTSTVNLMFLFSIMEFPNKVYVADRDGGKMFNGFLYMTPQLKGTSDSLTQQHKFDLCNKEPLVLSTITLRVTDINSVPKFLTVNGLSTGAAIELGINIKIEQDEKYQMMSVQKRNEELMVGLMAQKKEYNQ